MTVKKYIVYQLLALTEDKNKFYVEKQWMGIYKILNEYLKDLLRVEVKSGQSYYVPKKPRKNDTLGVRQVTVKKIKLGRLKWDFESNQKICTEYLKFDDGHVREIDILGFNEKSLNPHIHFYFYDDSDYEWAIKGGLAFNQSFLICIREDYYKQLTREGSGQLDSDIKKLIALFYSNKAFRSDGTPLVFETLREGDSIKTIHPLMWRTHADIRTGEIISYEERKWDKIVI